MIKSKTIRYSRQVSLYSKLITLNSVSIYPPCAGVPWLCGRRQRAFERSFSSALIIFSSAAAAVISALRESICMVNERRLRSSSCFLRAVSCRRDTSSTLSCASCATRARTGQHAPGPRYTSTTSMPLSVSRNPGSGWSGPCRGISIMRPRLVPTGRCLAATARCP